MENENRVVQMEEVDRDPSVTFRVPVVGVVPGTPDHTDNEGESAGATQMIVDNADPNVPAVGRPFRVEVDL